MFWESVIRSQQHAEISQREAVARISSWSIGVLLSIYDGQCTKCIAVKKIDVSWCWLLCYLGCRAAASFTKTQLKRRMKHRRLRHENRSVRYRNRCFDSPIYKGVGVCYVLVKMPISRPYIPTVKHNHDCCAACIRSKSFRVMLLYWYRNHL